MKKKLFIVLGALLALGLFFTGCSSDDSSSENDPFKGTWINAAQAIRIEAANKEWKSFKNNMETIRGTYTISGNTANAKTTEVNIGAFTGGANNWIKYSDLTSAQKAIVTQYGGPPETFTVTINGDTITAFGLTLTKQQPK